MAAMLIESMSGQWRPEDYRDTYTDRVKELIEAKRSGGEVTVAEAPPEATNVIDLMEVLRRSVENARRDRGTPESRSRAKTTAKAAGQGKKDLNKLSKSELAAMARDLNIAGRSNMDKEQLQEAIRKAA